MKIPAIFITTVTAAWLLAICSFFVFEKDVEEAVWIFTSIIEFALVALGVGIIILAGVAGRRRVRVAAVSCAITALGVLAFFTFGFDAGTRVRFALVQSDYERQVAEILAARDPASIPPSKDQQIDPGPPLRVAFPWRRGVIDNWVGLVYDPTGSVMKANEFKLDWSNWHDDRLRPVKQLFGGDMFRAKKLAKNWYLCSFT